VPAVIKRCFDIVVAFFGLLFLAPLLTVVALLVKLDSKGPILFKQERIGKGFKPFTIYKFRTMVENASQRGELTTSDKDPRITRTGLFLRRTKIDEIPQLINVLKGEMSIVGPRPEVHRYVELFRQDYEEILQVRPGITDLASLKYQDEAALLECARDPEAEYRTKILPDKIALAKEYLSRSSLIFDLSLTLRTLPKLWGRKTSV
jgi:lipopolysaccharide/colanic/teichoic acid biosynthesis glycosyltransferase